ncbi:hypothetical protein KBA73_00450 [Patescibacteria group bacterium]|nr:hypothetical protein [Patescibacteria group bacterium]
MPIRGSRRPNVVPITAPSFSTPSRPYVYRKIAYVFIALTVLIVIAVLWLSSMRAEVNVQVKRESVKIDHVIEISKSPRSGQLAGRVAQGELRLEKEFPLGGLAVATSTASTPAPVVPTPTVTSTSAPAPAADGIARGTVRIINKYSKPQTLVATTRLLTADGKLYRIAKRVIVPEDGEVSVEVYADKSGTEFSINPTQFTIPGLYADLQKLIYAISDKPFAVPLVTKSAVSATTTPTPTTPKPRVTTGQQPQPAEIQQALQQVRESVMTQLKQNLAAGIGGDLSAFEPVYFVSEEPKTAPGSTGDTFVASVKITMTAVYYPKDDMLVLIRTQLKEKVPSDRELVPFDENAITYSIESVDAKNETATIRVQAKAEYRLTLNSPALQKATLAGKSKEDVRSSLQSLDGVERVDIVTHPGWLSKLPSLQDHIDIKVN